MTSLTLAIQKWSDGAYPLHTPIKGAVCRAENETEG